MAVQVALLCREVEAVKVEAPATQSALNLLSGVRPQGACCLTPRGNNVLGSVPSSALNLALYMETLKRKTVFSPNDLQGATVMDPPCSLFFPQLFRRDFIRFWTYPQLVFRLLLKTVKEYYSTLN